MAGVDWMSNTLTDGEVNTLSSWMKIGEVRFNVLFQASKNGCDATYFHECCDNYGPTVTVVFVADGCAYGGYTCIPFQSEGGWVMDEKAFLFKLRQMNQPIYRRYPESSSNIDRNVFHGPLQGPAFAFGPDSITFFYDKCPGKNGYIQCNTDVTPPDSQVLREIRGTCNQVSDILVYHVEERPSTSFRLQRNPKSTLWRDMYPVWNNALRNSLIKEVKSFKPSPLLGVKKATILLVGQVGAGKSSFCTTVRSTLKGEISRIVDTGEAGESLTTTFRVFGLQYKDRSTLHFQIADTMGIQEHGGFTPSLLHRILLGCVEDGSKFDGKNHVKESELVSKSLNKRIHVVVFVVDGLKADSMPDGVRSKLSQFRPILQAEGIPYIVLLTKVDELSCKVAEDLTTVFHSEEVATSMDTVSSILGIPQNKIWPIRNYNREVTTKLEIDILALIALQQILKLAHEFFKDRFSKQKPFLGSKLLGRITKR